MNPRYFSKLIGLHAEAVPGQWAQEEATAAACVTVEEAAALRQSRVCVRDVCVAV